MTRQGLSPLLIKSWENYVQARKTVFPWVRRNCSLCAGYTVVALQRPQELDRVLGLQNPQHLPDADLVANFYLHRAEFERLREMIVQDKQLFRIDEKQTATEEFQKIDVPLPRIKQYRELIRALGIRGGVEVSSDRSCIEFTASSRGLVTHNSQKGYLYTEKSPDVQQVVGELDEFTARGTGSGIRHIDGKWYLFFEGY